MRPNGSVHAATVLGAALCATAAIATLAATSGSTLAQTDGASMARAPETASGVANPDHMPIKRPRKETNDKMMRTPPASAANAK